MSKPRLTKKQQIAAVQAAIAEADQEALEAGRLYHKQYPDALLAAVHRHANKTYDTRHEAEHFMEGYVNARRQRDDFNRERRGA